MAKKVSKRVVQQRKRIAHDVLEQIRVGRFMASPGTYVCDHDGEFSAQTDASAKLQTPKRQCSVCAIGSMFVAAIDRYNQVTVGDVCSDDDLHYGLYTGLSNSDSLTNVLGRWWSPEEMRVIEAAFEQNDSIAYDAPEFADKGFSEAYRRRLARAEEWGRKYDDATERLQAICKKIIRSVDGSFRV